MGEQDVRRMGGLRRSMPVVAWTYLIGVFAISGLLLSGFWSKEAMFSTLESAGRGDLVAIGLTVSFLTAFYMFRSYFLVFEGPRRSGTHAHAPGAVLAVPLLVLAVPSLVIGFVFSGALGHWGVGSLIGYLGGNGLEAAEGGGHGLLVISLALASAGLLLAWLFYGKPNLSSSAGLRKVAAPFFTVANRRFFWDDLYDGLVQKLYLGWAAVLAWFDRSAVDGAVGLVKPVFLGASSAARKTQTGSVKDYAAAIMTGCVIIGVLLVLLVR
jgi:NADH-quinone oxidoreductase subunit L